MVWCQCFSDLTGSPGPNQGNVRQNKKPNRKRRLAYARSSVMFNLRRSRESEYWHFPLPPISPSSPRMKSSFSSVDIWGSRATGKVPPRTHPPVPLCAQALHAAPCRPPLSLLCFLGTPEKKSGRKRSFGQRRNTTYLAVSLC